jgi:hypothetical protein
LENDLALSTQRVWKKTRKYGGFFDNVCLLPRLVNAGFANLNVRLGKYPMAVSILGCTAKIPVTALLDDEDGFSNLKLEAQFAFFFEVENRCKQLRKIESITGNNRGHGSACTHPDQNISGNN